MTKPHLDSKPDLYKRLEVLARREPGGLPAKHGADRGLLAVVQHGLGAAVKGQRGQLLHLEIGNHVEIENFAIFPTVHQVIDCLLIVIKQRI